MEREVLVFHRLAVQADEGPLLAEQGGELVHDAALDAAVVVLGHLADPGQFELVDAVAENLVQGKGVGALEGRAGTEAGAQGDISGKHGIEAFHLSAPLDHLAANAEDIAGPGLFGLVLLVQAELHELVLVQGEGLHLRGPIDLDGGHDAAVDGAGEDISPVVVRVFADEVDPAGGSVQIAFFAEENLEFLLDSFFHMDIPFSVDLQRYAIFTGSECPRRRNHSGIPCRPRCRPEGPDRSRCRCAVRAHRW